MKITFFGTTTLLFDDGKDQILFDAHLTRPSLMKYIFGSEASNTSLIDEKLKLHSVDRLKAIFVSHSHHDHVMDMPFLSLRYGAAVYGSASALNVARGGGVGEEKLVEFEAGQSYRIGDHSVKVLASLHSKPTILNNDLGELIEKPLPQPAGLHDYKEGGSYDFYIEHPEKRVLIQGNVKFIEKR